MPEERQRKKKYTKTRVFRLNLLFFFIFCLFTMLIVRLGVVQIVFGESYKKEVTRQDATVVSLPAPRGKMFDRHGEIIVDNEGMDAVAFSEEPGMKAADKIDVARKLAKLISLKNEKYKDRDLIDYWLAAYPEEAKALLTDEELKLTPKETYALQVERVSEEAKKAVKKNELAEAILYKRMTSGYMYEIQILKSEGLTKEEMAKVSENLAYLPGVDILTDWKRKYPFGEMFRPVLGSVTSAQQGILEERSSYYLSRGYSRNDRVGKSYLEYQYEELLHPKKGKKKYITDRNGNVVDEVLVSEGSRGNDLRLSVNAQLQKEVEKILEEEIADAKSGRGNGLLDRAFVVMMDPYSGEVLSIAGKMTDPEKRGAFLDYSVGTFASQYEIGSTIKGATVLAGYQTGAIGHGTILHDAPVYLAGAPKPKQSWKTMGNISDLTALKQSSNVYMFKTVMKMAGVNYVPHGGLPIKNESFLQLRNIYKQFGLGIPTGIDLPNEGKGFQGDPTNPGLLLDMSIGQFDTYTPLQMAQYVSAIANGGMRVKPHLVSSIHEPTREVGLGPIIQPIQPEVLNNILNTEDDIKRVQEGFRQVVQEPGGTAYTSFKHDVAGKTGTAQTFYYGPDRSKWGQATYNLTFVGYYPSKNPKVAISVVVPWASNDQYPINKKIANRSIEAFVKYEENRNMNLPEEEATTEEETADGQPQ
ncbi:penicillin-binding protein 2 [Bacillus sp. 31A1R]|uniref:serine-type D-Ala-D-Ala carboxypeptidase n=1 Tax=Robertmurraya mangrovi TaxID=3098077 RepID=A0ABU5IY00_9BACI|nr:penicillin-binding protein 2 [Bacillus sp. 31A1R]MDZ5472035.1 penicillin-binding protein 2 [Bacillus sp. 31A1R]